MTDPNFPWTTLLTEYHTITLYGQRRRPLSGDECTWTVTLIHNETPTSHTKRVGEGETPCEALAVALSTDGVLVKNTTKRHQNPVKTPPPLKSYTPAAKKARRMVSHLRQPSWRKSPRMVPGTAREEEPNA